MNFSRNMVQASKLRIIGKDTPSAARIFGSPFLLSLPESIFLCRSTWEILLQEAVMKVKETIVETKQGREILKEHPAMAIVQVSRCGILPTLGLGQE